MRHRPWIIAALASSGCLLLLLSAAAVPVATKAPSSSQSSTRPADLILVAGEDPAALVRQDVLDVPRQAHRVEHGQQVVLEKTARVSRLTTQPTKVVLERGQGTDGVRELDPRPPDRGRQVDPGGAREAQDEDPAQDHEEHEA